ncbi:hypothetical protein [Thalassobius sp. I31.1]|uniref:hypothetical protein n=1 Tax=Thalassobius sp. I31.1 TaxID=2109912 RepID=UPI000D19FECD|nr:hypothetical protein [Thalassobius sp. I31.1]
MDYTYPINLVGAEEEGNSGEVVPRHGEYIGTWSFSKNEAQETSVFEFVADGETGVRFSEDVPFLDSGSLMGLAMSRLCGFIREWHEEKEKSEGHHFPL